MTTAQAAGFIGELFISLRRRVSSASEESLTLPFTRARLAKDPKVIAAAQAAGMNVNEYIEIHAVPEDPLEIILSLFLPVIFVMLHGFVSWKTFRTRLAGQWRISSPFWLLTSFFAALLIYVRQNPAAAVELWWIGPIYLAIAIYCRSWNIDVHRQHNRDHPDARLTLGRRLSKASPIPEEQSLNESIEAAAVQYIRLLAQRPEFRTQDLDTLNNRHRLTDAAQ